MGDLGAATTLHHIANQWWGGPTYDPTAQHAQNMENWYATPEGSAYLMAEANYQINQNPATQAEFQNAHNALMQKLFGAAPEPAAPAQPQTGAVAEPAAPTQPQPGVPEATPSANPLSPLARPQAVGLQPGKTQTPEMGYTPLPPVKKDEPPTE